MPVITSKQAKAPPVPTLTAAMLYALSQGRECKGKWFCHWCGSPCDNSQIHDDPPPIPFARSYSTAKRPAEPYICIGCWLWRQKSMTISYIGGGIQDGQCPKDHSWLITDKVALALRSGKEKEKDFEELWRFLIAPAKRFTIMLRDPKDKIDSLIQLAIANNPGGILADTKLHYTLNGIPHFYSVYELIESLKNRNGHSSPGITALWNFLGNPPEDVRQLYPARRVENKGRGRPPVDEDKLEAIQTVVVGSGEKR